MTDDRRPPGPWRLSLSQLRRDLAAGELRLILWAVVLAVAALTAVGFFADRMRAGLWRDAAQLLGGDVVVLGDHPLPPAFAAQARARGFTSGEAALFPRHDNLDYMRKMRNLALKRLGKRLEGYRNGAGATIISRRNPEDRRRIEYALGEAVSVEVEAPGDAPAATPPQR